MRQGEFSKKTKREALARSGGQCEAMGGLYGLPSGHRCGLLLSFGVEFDHVNLVANSKDNSLENCAAVCIKCHDWKTRKHDIPMAAKTVRMQDKANGITRQRQKIQSRPKQSKPKPDKLPLPGRRPIYEERT